MQVVVGAAAAVAGEEAQHQVGGAGQAQHDDVRRPGSSGWATLIGRAPSRLCSDWLDHDVADVAVSLSFIA